MAEISPVPKPPLVVHIIYALGTGGLENGLVNIINRCPAERYRHAIVCLTCASEFAARITNPDVEIVELSKRPGHDLRLYWRLWKTLRRLRPDIVHTRNMAALEMHVLGLFLPSYKRVHGEHGRDVNDIDGSNRKYQRLRRLLRPFIHRFIAVSQDLATWLVNVVGIPVDEVTQIYNGVDQLRFSPKSATILPADCPRGFVDEGSVVVGTVGRLAAVKDQQLLIRALAHIFDQTPQRHEQLRCIIVGDGPERDALVDCIRKLGMEKYVWLAGDREDIPELLACMDVFVLPSLAEGISNTILEAMASGLPVIATAVGGNPELVLDDVTGILVPPGDVLELARTVNLLVDSPERRISMGEKALERIEFDFRWERTVSDYLSVYDEILRRPVSNFVSTGRR